MRDANRPSTNLCTAVLCAAMLAACSSSSTAALSAVADASAEVCESGRTCTPATASSDAGDTRANGGNGAAGGMGDTGPGGDFDGDTTDDGDTIAFQPIDAGASGFVWQDAGAFGLQTLAIPTNDLVVDPVRHLLYATVPDTSPIAPRSVITVDPAAAKLVSSLQVGHDLGPLAISDDGSALYLGFAYDQSVQLIDLTSGQAGALVSLKDTVTNITSPPQEHVAGAIRAVPGSSTRYVVRLDDPTALPPAFSGLALFDGATKLGLWYEDTVRVEAITLCDPTTLFGYDNLSSAFETTRFKIDPSGALQSPTRASTFSGYLINIVCDHGWVFGTDGHAMDATTMTLVANYNFGADSVWPDANGADVWFLTTTVPMGDSVTELAQFDRSSFAMRRTFALPHADAYATSLVKWSPTGFAFRSKTQLYLLTIPP